MGKITPLAIAIIQILTNDDHDIVITANAVHELFEKEIANAREEIIASVCREIKHKHGNVELGDLLWDMRSKWAK